MRIELGTLADGGVVMVADKPMIDIVKRVEYYSDQRQINLVYNNPDHAEDLMHFEIPDDMAEKVGRSPNILIYTLFDDHPPIGYKAPLIKVGNIY